MIEGIIVLLVGALFDLDIYYYLVMCSAMITEEVYGVRKELRKIQEELESSQSNLF